MENGTWVKGKLAIGIISIFLFIIITFQSCAAGVSNALSENGSVSGTNGFMLAVLMVVAGIVGIITRKSSGKGGAIATIILYWLAALLAVGTGSTFGDLPIWGLISFIFGLVFVGSLVVKVPKLNEGNNRKKFHIAFGVLLFVVAVIGFANLGSDGTEVSAGGSSLSGVENKENEKKEDVKGLAKYGLNEAVVVDTSYGSYRLTVTGVRESKDRNMFSDTVADRVVLISYTYENVDYDDSLNISDFNFKVYDKSSVSLESYPSSEWKYGESISVGRKSSGVMPYALNSSDNYLEMEFFDNMFSSKADCLFVLEW